MALEVEPDVAGRRRREQPEAPVLLVGEVVDAALARLAVVELELGLVADSLEGLRPHALDRRAGRRAAERGQRRDPLRREPLRVPPPEPGDEHEVVVVGELLLAQVAEVADPAVVARPRVRLRARSRPSAREEPLARAPEVRDVLGGAERLALARAELDVEVLRQLPLDPLELLGVEAELEHVRRLGRARELRVDGLVRAVRLALEEVGEPAPGAVREVRLVDDLRLAGADRLLGDAARLLGVEAVVVVGRDADDAPAVGLEPRQVRRLVLVALVADEVAVRVVDERPLELAALHAELELRQVRAGEVVPEVGRGEQQRAVVGESHHLEYQRKRGVRLRVVQLSRSAAAAASPGPSRPRAGPSRRAGSAAPRRRSA